MIFVDTGAWFASFVPWDPDHPEATRWLNRNTLPLLTTDSVVDETLTLLRARDEPLIAIASGEAFFLGELARIYFLAEDDIRAAWQTFRRDSDKEWSFTDCTSKVVMDRLQITAAFSFDHHFRQFGAIEVVP